MGLVFSALRFVYDIVESRCKTVPPSGASEQEWDGPDDTWPEDEPWIPSQDGPEPEITVIRQWGLGLPDGTVAWGGWQNVPFDNPLDRMRMIAVLQKTALNVGFAEGEQMEGFLGNYGWHVRDATVSTLFSPVKATFSLGDPAVAEVSLNGRAEEVQNQD